MSDFTPTTKQILNAAVATGYYDPDEVDRWYAAEVANARAEAWDEGFDAGWDEREDFAMCGVIPSGRHQSDVTNPYRADQIEGV